MVFFKYGWREDIVGLLFYEWEVCRLFFFCVQFCFVFSNCIGKISICQVEVFLSEGVQWYLGKGIWKVFMWFSLVWKQGGNFVVLLVLVLFKWFVKSYIMFVLGLCCFIFQSCLGKVIYVFCLYLQLGFWFMGM